MISVTIYATPRFFPKTPSLLERLLPWRYARDGHTHIRHSISLLIPYVVNSTRYKHELQSDPDDMFPEGISLRVVETAKLRETWRNRQMDVVIEITLSDDYAPRDLMLSTNNIARLLWGWFEAEKPRNRPLWQIIMRSRLGAYAIDDATDFEHRFPYESHPTK